MKLPFLNRHSELTKISSALEAKEPSLLVIYGRRRCGKSRFINELHNRRLIYHLADFSEPALQRANLAKDISSLFPGFSEAVYPTWESLFVSFFSRAANENSSLYALALDEFPYIAQLDPSVPSILQKLFDTGKMKSHLLLCGSSQRMMHGLVLDGKAPLYGRASEILKIRPLSAGWIRDALALHGSDAIKAYAVWGGVPRYWEAAMKFHDLKEAVSELILNRNGLLHQEPHRLLLDEMRSDVQPHSLLSVIAGGCHRLSEIAGRLEKQAVSLANPIGLLTDLSYVKRDIPYGESLRSTKRTLYRLCDPFLLFWYRFVYPHLSLLEQDVIEPVIQQWEAAFSLHCGDIWEELARLSVPRLKIGGIQWKEAYRWWGKKADQTLAEVDIVANSIDGKRLLIGEAKWGAKTDPEAVLNDLRSIVEKLPFARTAEPVFACWTPNEAAEYGNGFQVINAEQTLDALQ
jgi:hypothetical protein